MTAPPPDDLPGASPNRLSIAHFMLWMLGSGVVLAFHRMQATPVSGIKPSLQMVISLFAILGSLPSGAGIASLALWAYRRSRGVGGFPVQPGHWPLFVTGLMIALVVCQFTVGTILQHPLETLAFHQQWDADLFRLSLALGPPCLAGAAAYGVALWRVRGESRLWNAAVGSLIVQFACGHILAEAGLLWAIFSGRGDSEVPFIIAYQVGYIVFSLISGVLFAWAAFEDRWRKDRDFLHWTGITSLFASIAFHVASMLVFSLLQR